MGIQLSARATKAWKAIRDSVIQSFVQPMKPDKKNDVKKEDGTLTERTLEEEECFVKMEVSFYKYKRYLQPVLD